MRLRTLLVADALVFIVAAITFGVLYSNDPTPGRYYDLAYWPIVALLVVLIAGVLFEVVRYFAKLS